MDVRSATSDWLKSRQDANLSELFDFLRIPSVSALPQNKPDIERAANWVADRMRKTGIPEVEVLSTGGHPLVWGRWKVDPTQPTALLYAHYDVQPPDPLELWESPAFEPQIRDGKIYCRGVGDDKGGLFSILVGLEALVAQSGKPPVNLIFFFEGEEEIGSPSVQRFLRDDPGRFTCDYVISGDGMMWSEDDFSLTVASKGLAGCQVDLQTADVDTHSGLYGATIRNAAQAMAELASTFHTEDGAVAVDGFYDGVIPLTEGDHAEAVALPFSESDFLAHIGATTAWGEPGYSTVERSWMRPTLDFNGMWSGFQGAGSKTVTPSQAHLKITCRLVPGQDPARILDLIANHVARNTPVGATCTISATAGSSGPFAIDRNDPCLVAARKVLKEMNGKDPYLIKLGGTLPIAETFQQELGADMVFFAFSLPECNAHAPNEWHRLVDLDNAAIGTALLLTELAR